MPLRYDSVISSTLPPLFVSCRYFFSLIRRYAAAVSCRYMPMLMLYFD